MTASLTGLAKIEKRAADPGTVLQVEGEEGIENANVAVLEIQGRVFIAAGLECDLLHAL